MSDRHQLTEVQMSILRHLWAHGEATVAEIWEGLQAERGWALTTVATLLTRLERRGVVSHRTENRVYVYQPLVSEEDVQHSMVSELTERLFDGDVTALVSHLLTAQEMSPGDLARVREMMDSLDGRKEAPRDR